MKLSVLMITNNAEEVIEEALKSVNGLWDELLVADDQSTDRTREIVKRYGGKVFLPKNKNLGERKEWLITKARGDWILILDSDERVSSKLRKETKAIVAPGHDESCKNNIKGYRISYQNYVFGGPVYWGGERYSKVRLFRREYGRVTVVPLHEEVIVQGKIGTLQGIIRHYSFRTPQQLFCKFTNYAKIACQQKRRQGETLSIKKLFFFGPHMFWARYVKEGGYKDGWRGIILASAFAYMEGLTYWLLLL